MITDCIQQLTDKLLQNNITSTTNKITRSSRCINISSQTTNMEEVLTDLFYHHFNNSDDDNSDNDNQDDDTDNNQDESKVDLNTLHQINSPMAEYVQKNEYEKLLTINRQKDRDRQFRIQSREPKGISNNGIIRLFTAQSYEYIYAQIMKTIFSDSSSHHCNIEPDDTNPIINYEINHYFDSQLYEEYLATLVLPSIYSLSPLINPRFLLVIYNYIPEDRIIIYNGVNQTFKVILYNILNGKHFPKNYSLHEINNMVIDIKDNAGDKDIENLLEKMIRASKYALYILALNFITKQKITLKRVGSCNNDLYLCNITKRLLLKIDNSSTIYYAAKHKGWIFRTDNNDTIYYNDSILVVFHTIVSQHNYTCK